MPTNEYECEKCGCRFEKYQNMSDPPLESCPECRGAVRRLIGTGGAVIMKGDGRITALARNGRTFYGVKQNEA